MAKAKTTKVTLTDAQKAERAAAKVAKFVDIGKKRMTAALNAIRLIGNLSATGSYTYTEEQTTKMRKTLDAALEETFVKFKAKGAADKVGFEF